ncbi:MAG: hypothetical protein QW587_03025 [Candidatus Bathyarchaeia archaeon]
MLQKAAAKAALLYSDDLRFYDFGPGHPFRGDRYASFLAALREKLGAEFPRRFDLVEPRPASLEELTLVHEVDYVKRVEAGISWDPDTPLTPRLVEAAKLIAGSALLAAKLVAEGKYAKGVVIGGGMHHAKRSHEAGFCVFNDVALCFEALVQRHGLSRVMILDTDAHAGDGTAELLYESPNVLFVDLHQDPRTLYPGRGFIHELGSGPGEGRIVNIPMPPGASDNAYEYALKEVFAPLAEEFKPQVILRNGGSDPHFADRLTNLGLTLRGLRMVGRTTAEVADAICGGRVIDLIGSGYNPTVLPYGWAALVSGLIGLDIELTEPLPPPRWLNADAGIDATVEVVRRVKSTLSRYWRCFA